MAQRFGGPNSPEPQTNSQDLPKNSWRGKQVSRAGARVNFLFLAPLPMAVRAFFLDAPGLVGTLAGLGLLLLAAWMTREGLLAEEAYMARKISRRPALPRKVLGSVLTGAGLFVAVWSSGTGWTNPVIFALLGTVLHSFSFGIDPMRNKGMEGIDQFQQDRVAKVVHGAEKHLKSMETAIQSVGDRELERRVDQFQETAREMFRTVEDDPRDLSSARRYLGVYLMGARDATIKFADLFARSRNSSDRDDYLALLGDLEQGFTAKTKALLMDNKSDLSTEIEVLRERLAREGVKINEL